MIGSPRLPARVGRRLAIGLVCLAAAAIAHAAAPPAGAMRDDVVFGVYTPLSSNAELARRLLSPLTAARIPAILAKARKMLAVQPIDLTRERFTVYAPAQAPAGGYGLLVFVPPWENGGLPQGWAPVLDRAGVIFVSASQSGNSASPFSRRAPLALLAAVNIMARYPVDPQRVYVGGLSGGSRVAMRLALGYPDLFTGALLNAGSDPIGQGDPPLPPAELFARFQTLSRLVYVTGARDFAVLDKDGASQQSMREWCVFHIDNEITPLVGHEAAGSGALARALDALARPARPDPRRLAACRAHIAKGLAAALAQAEALVTAGKTAEARKSLSAIDHRFGGLASPRSVELAAKAGIEG